MADEVPRADEVTNLTPEQVAQVRQRVATGEKKTALARELGVNRDTLYEALKG